jgi:hypothetical protein
MGHAEADLILAGKVPRAESDQHNDDISPESSAAQSQAPTRATTFAALSARRRSKFSTVSDCHFQFGDNYL